MANMYTEDAQKYSRIVFITHEFRSTGAPLSLLDVVQKFSLESTKCYIVGPINGDLHEKFKVLGVEVISSSLIDWLYIGRQKKMFRTLYLPLRLIINLILQLWLVLFFFRIRPNGIYLNSFATRFAALPAKLSRAKVIWHIHEYKKGWGWTRVLISYFVAWCSDIVILNSKATLNWWQVPIQSTVYRVLYNPHPRVEQPLVAFDQKGFDIIFLGRITHDKGIEVLLEAMTALNKQGLKLKTVIVGSFKDPQYKFYIKDFIIKQKLEDQITFCEDPSEPFLFLRTSRILVLPSYSEGFGRVLVEALTFHVPVIASNIGGIPEIVTSKKIGILIDPGDVKSLAENIKLLITDRGLNTEMGQAGYIHVKQNFSDERFASDVKAIYDICLNQNKLVA